MDKQPVVSRRQWLKASSAALAAPAFLSAQNTQNEVRTGIIGTGGRGSTVLTRAMRSPGVRLVAVCDIDPEALRRGQEIAERDKPDAIVNFRDLLDRKDIDAVIIATPVDLHKEMAMAALEVHKNVYLEKPLGRTPEEVKSIMQAVESSRGMMQVGFQLRHDPARAAAIEHIHDGGIGQVAYMQGNRHGGDLPREKAWLFDAARSGNSIVEQACHILDLMNWAIQDHPLRAMGSGGINVYRDEPPGRTVFDNYAVVFDYPGGVRLSFTHLFIDPPGFTGLTEKVWGTEWAVDLPSATKHRLPPPGSRGQTEKVVLWEGESADPTQASVDAFFENIRRGSEPLNNAKWAKYATLMAIMGRMAMEEQRIVTWDEVDI